MHTARRIIRCFVVFSLLELLSRALYPTISIYPPCVYNTIITVNLCYINMSYAIIFRIIILIL